MASQFGLLTPAEIAQQNLKIATQQAELQRRNILNRVLQKEIEDELAGTNVLHRMFADQPQVPFKAPPQDVNEMLRQAFQSGNPTVIKGVTDFINIMERMERNGDVTKKEFAPDIQQFRNPTTGEVMGVNVRDLQSVNAARQEGFVPIGPRARGFLVEAGKSGARREVEIAASSSKARSNIATLRIMDGLLDRFESGRLADWEKTLQQWGSALGFNIDTTNLSAKEAFTAMAEQLALQSRNLGEGMVLAGQMSDRDVKFLRDMNPQLVISKSGNRTIIKLREAVAKQQIEIAKLASKFKRQRQGILDPLEFEVFVQQELGDKSIFGLPEGINPNPVGTDKKTGLPVYEKDGKFFIPEF